MLTMNDTRHPVLGIDICLRTFVAVLWFGAGRSVRREFKNHAGGFRALCTWLRQHFAAPVRVGIECTNVYADALAEWMHVAGHEVYLLNAERVAYFARGQGQRNKTDPADALTVAKFTAQYEGTPWIPPTPQQKTLRSLTRARAQLVEMRNMLSAQRKTAAGPGGEHLEKALAAVVQQIKAIERKIAQFVKREPLLRRAVARLMTIKGVALTTAAVVLAELPQITEATDPRTICGWAGLVPCRHQSGQTELRARRSRRGNAYLRQALYMPALVAKRWNPLLKTFAQRLAARGKSTPAILGAVAHKLLRIIVGMLRTDTDFDPQRVSQKN
jgi:transposase